MRSSNHTIQVSLTDRSTSEDQIHQVCLHTQASHSRHHAPYARSHHFLQCHCRLCLQPSVATLDRTKQLLSTRTPLQSASFPVVVEEKVGILSVSPLARWGGVQEKAALRAVALPGAAALCYTARSSRLLVPSSPKVRRQSVQMDDHHLCPGMPLNPVHSVVDAGDDVIGTFPACL